ncbi:Apolipoprotein B-100, partial [Dissostichus eleginoides]
MTNTEKDNLLLILGFDLLEATASLKYNRNKNTLTTEVVIPDYDVEAGIRLAVIESDSRGKKMRGITIDVTNRNIPQLTLVGHTRLHMMNDAMLQLQMVIPILKTEASVSATLKKDKDVLMDLVTAINLPKTSYQQKASLKFDDDKFEVELKSDMNIEIHKLIPTSTKINSNFYSWEGSISGGNNTVDVPNYIVQYKAMAQSPFNLLSYKLEAFTINLKKLQEISIPAQISVPEFTVLNTYTIPAFTIDFDEIKANIIYIIDNIREFEIELHDPGEIFEASAKTTAKATTQIYTANLVNNMKLTLKNGIFAVIDTNYDHSVDNPSIETSNQAS